jgi:hypothetical protein
VDVDSPRECGAGRVSAAAARNGRTAARVAAVSSDSS